MHSGNFKINSENIILLKAEFLLTSMYLNNTILSYINILME
jgi:hypothetical protein